jgi:hypothetical protein
MNIGGETLKFPAIVDRYVTACYKADANANEKYISVYLATPDTANNNFPESEESEALESKNERYVKEYNEEAHAHASYVELNMRSKNHEFDDNEFKIYKEWKKKENKFDDSKQIEFFNLFPIPYNSSNYKQFYSFLNTLGGEDIKEKSTHLKFAKIEIKHPSKYSSIWRLGQRKRMAAYFWENVKFTVPEPCGYYDFKI